MSSPRQLLTRNQDTELNGIWLYGIKPWLLSSIYVRLLCKNIKISSVEYGTGNRGSHKGIKQCIKWMQLIASIQIL